MAETEKWPCLTCQAELDVDEVNKTIHCPACNKTWTKMQLLQFRPYHVLEIPWGNFTRERLLPMTPAEVKAEAQFIAKVIQERAGKMHREMMKAEHVMLCIAGGGTREEAEADFEHIWAAHAQAVRESPDAEVVMIEDEPVIVGQCSLEACDSEFKKI